MSSNQLVLLNSLIAQQNFSSLQAKIQTLTAEGSTRLYGTSFDTLKSLAMSAHANNVLLFTDGEDSARDSQEMRQLSELVSGLLLEAKARNKFFVIFCGTDGDALTKDIAKTFDSPIIHTQSADFMSAIKDPEKLKSYAAERGLFTVKYSVHLETGPKTETNTHLIADLSGQIVALDPVEINPNSTLSITIAQGDQTLVDSKKSFTPPVVQQGTNPNGFLNRSSAHSSTYQDPLNTSQLNMA
ncbi:TPA: hypothetical protein I9259_003170 [Legionella pneumophila]|nr:hypothetical protein [Legionella pneumophila]HAT6831976.1 hypothetical protein [Legionella pneumophila]